MEGRKPFFFPIFLHIQHWEGEAGTIFIFLYFRGAVAARMGARRHGDRGGGRWQS